MSEVHLTASLVERIHATQFEYLRSRMNVIRDLRGDPAVAQYLEAGYLRACVAPGIPNPAFNQIFISGPATQGDLERALALFEETGMTPQIEFGPGAISLPLAQLLTERGFLNTQSGPLLIRCESEPPVPLESELQITEVHTRGDLETFKDVYLRGWQVPDWLAPTLQSYMDHWLHRPGWTLYLAHDRNVALGLAVLFVHLDVAYLADAATAPELRTRGAQRALISRRIADASKGGRRLIFSRADFGSASQRNLERAGLLSRYSVAIWTKS